MPYPRVHAMSDIGKEHHTNEDSWAVIPLLGDADELVLVVCDGMGGMGRGDEASSLAIQVITDHVTSTEAAGTPPFTVMEDAILRADVAIRAGLCEFGRGRPGCTAVAAFFKGPDLYVSWVGDSPLYVIRDGAVLYRTRDHKLVEDLVESGDLTPAEAKTSSLSSVLTRALGGRKLGGKTLSVAHSAAPIALKPGDRILLCSDGLVDLVSHDEVIGLATRPTPAQAVEASIQIALDRGGHDNITVIVAEWTGEAHPVVAARSPVRLLAEDVQNAVRTALNGLAPGDHTAPIAPSREFEPYSETPLPVSRRPEQVVTETPPPPPVAPHPPQHHGAPAAPIEVEAPLTPVAAIGIVALGGALAWGLVQGLRALLG